MPQPGHGVSRSKCQARRQNRWACKGLASSPDAAQEPRTTPFTTKAGKRINARDRLRAGEGRRGDQMPQRIMAIRRFLAALLGAHKIGFGHQPVSSVFCPGVAPVTSRERRQFARNHGSVTGTHGVGSGAQFRRQ
jgi:hypothetical protein